MMVMSVAELRLGSNKGCEAKWWCKRKSRQPAQSVELPLGQINAPPPILLRNFVFTCSSVCCGSCSQHTQNCCLLHRAAVLDLAIQSSSWAQTDSWDRAAVGDNLGSFVSDENGQNPVGRWLSDKCSLDQCRRSLAACYRKMQPRHTAGSVQAVQAADGRRILIGVPAVAGYQTRSTWTVWSADSSPASSGTGLMRLRCHIRMARHTETAAGLRRGDPESSPVTAFQPLAGWWIGCP
ncbi:hypothetical protein FJTKL_10348 [Diaporthe vaccinii]|uniref:Uncharacterized protein n=1 Tax=Diaporthe vaccinii TaxID=105482 RepID=A0ABR4EJU9_9PEZI